MIATAEDIVDGCYETGATARTIATSGIERPGFCNMSARRDITPSAARPISNRVACAPVLIATIPSSRTRAPPARAISRAQGNGSA
jgi:hypothetical protein